MKVSLIISSENTTLEKDLKMVLSDLRTFYMKYVPGHGESERERRKAFEELSKMKHDIEDADVIIYARSYGVFSKRGWNEFKKFFSVPVVISTESIINTLKRKGSQNVFLVTPYNQFRHDYEVKWLRDFGFKVIGSIAMGRTGGPAIASTPYQLVQDSVSIGHRNQEVDSIYVACTILSTIPILDKLKGEKPVITAASAILEELENVRQRRS
ncbi:maleate cis-trans isomerase [Sulfuracidifex metallicus]|uniref:Maleate cis-trans isomerase n=1 Tax=Sulfuracidifex metallicus DSM 6482 = JCM 9184 TaxID=523847 RepID=A0A6A9QNP5_SULME|nr:maleate cis-trans isomerase [Sulfuracidifex metallicus]MUN29368.1 maleate cis-trans isomerase [Sulfuracidifex metallicus DSM 6482 = JCM 9184]WOE50120.1 maleate cis-trans isomerase [Sulfuracidifex metallicus DSM 6482 = JCM 9184]